MNDKLRSKTINALYWSFFERIGQQGIRFIITVVLARLLLPSQYGLIGMLAIFMELSQTLLDSGFVSAIIQKEKCSDADLCSVFYFNISVGLVLVIILYFGAPFIAEFYREPQLVALTRFLSLNLLISSFGIIQIAILIKQFDFKAQAKVTNASLLASGCIGIILALNGCGVWSLVIQQSFYNIFRSLLLWLSSSWRPSLTFEFSSLRGMFGFGSRLLATGIVTSIFDNLYLVVIGKLFSATGLGFYTRALGLQQVPASLLTDAVGSVTFPMFSSIQSDPIRLKMTFRRALGLLGFVNFPVFIMLAIIAKPLILLLFTERWLPCVPYFQLLLMVGLIFPLHIINLNLLKALGRSDLILRIEILKKILIAATVAVTWHWGIQGLIYGQMLLAVVSYYINSFYTAKLINYSLREQIGDLLPALLLAIVMGGGLLLFPFLPTTSVIVTLLIQVVSGSLIYGTLAWYCRLSSCLELIAILRERLKPAAHDTIA